MEGSYDQLLTDYSVGFMEFNVDDYVATKVFPTVPVSLQASSYKIYPRGYFLQDQVHPRPEGGVPREVEYRTQKGSYYTEEEGLRAKIDKNEAANWVGDRDPRQNKIDLLTSQHMIHRERKWAQAYFRTGVWTVNRAGVASGPTGTQFVQHGAATNIVDFWIGEADAMALATGVRPNTLILGRDLLRGYRNNQGVIDAIKYTQRGVVSQDLLAELFELDNVFSPTGTYNTVAGEVIDPTTLLPVPRASYAWLLESKSALLCYSAPNAGLNGVTAGVHFAWNQVGATNFGANGPAGGGGFNTAVYRGVWDYGEWFDVLQAWTPAIVAPDLGQFYSAVVA
jgi:hypothetical protein